MWNKAAVIIILSVIFLMIVGLWPIAELDSNLEIRLAESDGKEEYLTEIANGINVDTLLPNIVLIVLEGVGTDDINLQRDSTNVTTPTVAWLARGGTTFHNAYATSLKETPYAASLITGRCHNRIGIEYNLQQDYPRNRLSFWWAKVRSLINQDGHTVKWNDEIPSRQATRSQGLPTSEIGVAEMLKYGAGYHTGLFGSWHLGYKEGKLPVNFGYDSHYGSYQALPSFKTSENEEYIEMPLNALSNQSNLFFKKNELHGSIVRNDSIISEKRYYPDAIAQQAIAFMKKHKKDRFFAHISFSLPHASYQVHRSFYNRYSHISDPHKRIRTAVINNLDLNIGKMYNYLNNSELLQNTVIVFMTNTTESIDVFTEPQSFINNHRISLIIHQNNRYLNDDVHENVSILDIAPTILNIADVDIPKHRKMDGLALPIGETMPNDWALIDQKKEVNMDTSFHSRILNWTIANSGYVLYPDQSILHTTYDDHSGVIYSQDENGVDEYDMNPDSIQALIDLHMDWKSEMTEALWPSSWISQ